MNYRTLRAPAAEFIGTMLFVLVGAGSMPTVGTSNTTLTIAALSFRTAEHIAKALGRPLAVTGNAA